MINRSTILRSAVASILVLSVGRAPSSALAQPAAPGVRVNAAERLISVGQLIRSGRARNGTPRFALLDGDGNVTAYVAPASGVNMARHLNRHVAVTARQVSQDGDGLPYLLASSITGLSALRNGQSTAIRDDDASQADGANEPRIVAEFDDEADDFEQLAAWEDTDEYAADDFGSDLAWNSELTRDHAVRQAADYAEEETLNASTDVLPLPDDSIDLLPQSFGRQGSDCGNPNCSSCAPCGPCTDACCPCGPAGRFWFRVEYLGWSTKSMNTPPLVTTSPAGTPPQDAGVLGVDGTSVITGSKDSDSQAHSGVRFLFGGWFDACQHRGWEFDYYYLDEETDSFNADSIGDPILARPFFNTELGIQDAELVAYPGIVSGSVGVDRRTEFRSFTPRYRHNLRCENFYPMCGGCGSCDSCGPAACGPMGGSRVDLTVGYRYLRLNEGLYVSEELISSADSSFATFDLYDAFETSNEFSGLELGLVWDVHRGRWSMELAGRFSLGNNRRKVAINGTTTSVTQGAVFNDVGGLLALPSNIGVYKDDEFVVIPEFNLTFGYEIAPRVRLLLGYTVVYWNNVVRPGDHIDLNINPDLLPPAIDGDGMLSPAFALNDTTFWAQGVNLGIDWRW